MRIPEIRERLLEKAVALGDPELAELAHELTRRRARRVAAQTSQPMTDELADRIRDMAKRNPTLPYTRIAQAFNVNPGRVSEALRGFRQ